MKRRYQNPDTRPSWRDPDMPVLILMADTNQLEPFDPYEAQAAFRHWHENNPEPHWSDDPTYNMRRRKSK